MDTTAALFVANKLINELLDSSSSSDDDEEDILAILTGRPPPLEPRAKNFVDNVINSFTEDEFKKNLRVSRDTAFYLIKLYSRSPFRRSYKGGKQQLSAETQIMAFLWFIGNRTNYREVAKMFGISLSAMHLSFSKVLKFITTEIAPDVIKFPESNDEKDAMANEFEEITGFPNVLGCVARCSISKRYTKSSNTLDNNDPHNGTTMFLQAVCDTRLKFLDVSTADPNNILPESGISNPCFIGKDLAKICSPQYHLLGNDLYPLREYLLTPYPEKEFLSDSEKNYNEKFMETYESIKRALNILKSRFRQLTKTLEFTNVEIMSQFIVSCCVLHNICIDRDDFHYAQTTNELVDIHTGPQKSDDLGDLGLLQLGHFKRNETKEHLFILTKD